MQVFVRDLAGKTLPIHIDTSRGVASLQEVIESSHGILASETRMVYGGHSLEAPDDLLACGLVEHSTVFLTSALIGGAKEKKGGANKKKVGGKKSKEAIFLKKKKEEGGDQGVKSKGSGSSTSRPCGHEGEETAQKAECKQQAEEESTQKGKEVGARSCGRRSQERFPESCPSRCTKDIAQACAKTFSQTRSGIVAYTVAQDILKGLPQCGANQDEEEPFEEEEGSVNNGSLIVWDSELTISVETDLAVYIVA